MCSNGQGNVFNVIIITLSPPQTADQNYHKFMEMMGMYKAKVLLIRALLVSGDGKGMCL